MKKRILLSSLFAIVLANAFQANAQTVITNDNLPLEAYTSSLVLIDPIDYISPTEGPDQEWDYSGISNTIYSTPGLYEANHPDFPDAVIYKSYLANFSGYQYQRDDYYEQDANGRYRVGSIFENVGYSITNVTGGALDSLWFGGSTLNNQVGIDLEIKFPLEYGTQWTTYVSNQSPFELTVAGFGLDHAPGALKQYIDRAYEVVGNGTLTLPSIGGGPADPIDVVLLKLQTTTIDSLFLNGAPAPLPLMAAFGLTQGTISSFSDYYFYTPNYQDEVLGLNPETLSGFYRIDATTLDVTSVESNNHKLSGYPNPIASGAQFSINATMEHGTFSICNVLGEVVYTENITNNGANLSVRIPEQLTQGIYLYQLNDSNGKLIGSDMLRIQ